MSKDYSDMLNRKTVMDKVGDAFTDQANSMRPMNVGQRREQALFRGLGAGFGINPAREAKLAELENMSKELSMNKYALEMQSGKNELKKQKLLSFLNENHAGLSQLSEYIYAGKHNEVDILAPEILKSYGDITGDKIGKFNHYKNGYATFIDETGNPKTINIKNLLQPVMDLLPADQKKEYRGFLSPLQNADIDRMVKAQELQMQKYQADIEASKAHAELYKSQAEKARNDVKNPPMNDQQKILFKADVDSNKDYIKDVGKKIISDKVLVKTLNETEEMLVEAAKKGQVGSDLIAQARRKWGKYISGNNKEITIVDMAKAAYFARVKEAGGSNPSTTEFLTALETIPNTDKNLLASLNILRKDKINALNNIYRFNNIEKNLRTNNYQGSPYDENVVNFNEDEFNNYVKENSSKKTIKVSKVNKNTGKKEIIEIPLEDYEEVYNDGYSFVGK
jgi:hypothetical protein